MSSESLSASGQFRAYTLDGATRLNLQTIGKAPCRRIKLLNAGAYTLVLTPATALTTPTESIDCSGLLAGDQLDVQATAIESSSTTGLKVLVQW